ncbi:hypothetical protein ACPV40_14790 [Vibrio alfacsensis]|uniref:hypothetical protein n=1 Tax=Vibrio alfacsensis TaxID=1074311 RepID=UPI0040698679
MEQILSGFLGSIVGAFVSWLVYSRSEKNEAIDKLISIVYAIGFDCRNSQENIANKVFQTRFTEVWCAYSRVNSRLSKRQRLKLTEQWRKFMVMEGYFDDSNPDYWDIFKKGNHNQNEGAVMSCAAFITFLESIR